MPCLLDGSTRLITNAGGINPVAAGRAVVGAARDLGMHGVKVATVVGDDVRGRAAELGLPSDALFASAYLGARPIVDALDAGAQLLYEVHDPARYFSPDVVADFTSLRLDDLGGNRVRVSGTRAGSPPVTDTYKGLVCTPAGWAGEARIAYSWPDAEAKARAAL